jgi:hypothetical protein
MKNLSIILVVSLFFFTSCDWPSSGSIDWVYIYIDGDEGRQVEISYLAREMVKNTGKNKDEDGNGNRAEYIYTDRNVVVRETVQLPFFKEAVICQFINEAVPDCFLQINTARDDSTTRAIIFDNSFFIVRSNSSICHNIPGNLSEKYGYTEDCDTCTTCRGLTPDSILNYIKTAEYPCYMEFKGGETSKKVRMYNYWGYSK